MLRFLRLWFFAAIGYAVIGYLMVATLFLGGLAGWSDGPSSGGIPAIVAQDAQEIYAFGIFGSPWLRPYLFISPGKQPWISAAPTPEETKMYSERQNTYRQQVKKSASRTRLIYVAWVTTISFALAALLILLPARKNKKYA